MANEQHLAQLKQGVNAWNDWRKKNPGLRPNLRVAHLLRANLTEAILNGADLTDASFTGADLRETLLLWATLTRTDLTGADLAARTLDFELVR